MTSTIPGAGTSASLVAPPSLEPSTLVFSGTMGAIAFIVLIACVVALVAGLCCRRRDKLRGVATLSDDDTESTAKEELDTPARS